MTLRKGKGLGPVIPEIGRRPFVKFTGDAKSRHVVPDQILNPVVAAGAYDHPRADVGRDRVEGLLEVCLVSHDHAQARSQGGWSSGRDTVPDRIEQSQVAVWDRVSTSHPGGDEKTSPIAKPHVGTGRQVIMTCFYRTPPLAKWVSMSQVDSVSPVQEVRDQRAPKTGFRPDIEGLRAVAVVAVVLFHAGVPGVGGGFIGVDVFFVISGFLITGMLWREVSSTGGVRLSRFYGARARRLLPASATVGVVTAIGSAILLSPLEVRERP